MWITFFPLCCFFIVRAVFEGSKVRLAEEMVKFRRSIACPLTAPGSPRMQNHSLFIRNHLASHWITGQPNIFIWSTKNPVFPVIFMVT